MIIVTGSAGFIGSRMVEKLNRMGRRDLILVDDFSRTDKNRNLDGLFFQEKVERLDFPNWLEQHRATVEAIVHLGARTDTTERSTAIFDELNLHFSQTIWRLATAFGIPFLYASSAATYGLGEFGYDDDHSKIPFLKPLNPYGQSKQDFDVWVLQQPTMPPRWAGFKFFNVYGPNEFHKGRMASVIFHTANRIKETGAMQLFRSHRPDFEDGGQRRDFIFVNDVVDVLAFFLENQPPNGIYNLGTGEARTFMDLATATFRAMGREPHISFIDTPADIRDTYQYFTEANMTKLRAAGFSQPFYTLEAGVEAYVKRWLL